ncbi:hypothetical protein V6N13_095449 [Hibiscus sabdariffa]|uniref:Uncharacterized protein n=2 Tax=Hibiscus sabdariffa TaxID=183260 RepID=A0ABR2PRY3_9ROSI
MFKENHNLPTMFLQACMGTRLDNFRHMESIRNTMLMHEDVFRHQVQELHRLYSVQKILMDELKKEVKKNRFWTSTSSDMNQSQFSNQHQITTQTTSGLDLHVQGDPRVRGFDLERPAGEEAATVVAEDQAGPSSRTNQMMSTEDSDEDSEVELTLSIGIGGSDSSKKKLKNSSTSSQSVHNKEITREPDSSASCSGPGTPVSSSSATFDQEKKQPHWLFQGFSINRT